MTETPKRLTVEDYMQRPEERHVQLIDGGLVMEPSPNLFHQEILTNLVFAIGTRVRANELGMLIPDINVFLSKHDVLEPDLSFVSNANTGILRDNGIHGGPDLVIEILSPSTGRYDRGRKRELYCQHGVKEMWLVDPLTLQIHRYDFRRDPLKPVELIDESEFFSSPLLPGLSISAAEIFKR